MVRPLNVTFQKFTDSTNPGAWSWGHGQAHSGRGSGVHSGRGRGAPGRRSHLHVPQAHHIEGGSVLLGVQCECLRGQHRHHHPLAYPVQRAFAEHRPGPVCRRAGVRRGGVHATADHGHYAEEGICKVEVWCGPRGWGMKRAAVSDVGALTGTRNSLSTRTGRAGPSGGGKAALPVFWSPTGGQPAVCTLALWWLKFGPTGRG